MGRSLLLVALLICVVLASFGCATIFHSDRMNMPPERRGSLDVGMFILDIFFFWPWSWLVDFLTGCIWLPRTY